MLYDRMEYYKATGKTKRAYPASYKAENPWLKKADSLALANVQLNLQKAYNEFFNEKNHRYTDKAVTKAKRQGRELTFYDFEKHPKFKSKKANDWHSYTTNNQNGTITVSGDHIRLPKIGLVKSKVHRKIPEDGVIKSATVSRSATGKHYISILVEYEREIEPVLPETSVGLDYSMKELYVDHENNCPPFHQFYRESESKLAVEQRRLSKMEKGSNNYNKQREKIAKLHEKISNQRKDFLHKQSDSITKKNDVVCVEDLDMKAMAQSLRFGKSVSDNGWGMFTRYLEYKQIWSGHYFIRIEKQYPSSKLCHACGYINKDLQLSDREWTCKGCGTHHLRDYNAAINVRKRGMDILAAQLGIQ